MEIRIYNSALDLQGIIENQTSLLWRRCYFSPGDFELHAPVTADNVRMLQIGNLVALRGGDDAGIVEDFSFEESADKIEITAKGRFLAAYMGYRIIRGTMNIDTTAELAMRQLLGGASPIPLVEMGEVHGFPRSIAGQVTNKNLLSFMTKLAKAGTIGFRFRPDFRHKRIIFETYAGVDRSEGQCERSRVVFSEAYDNINGASYRVNDQSFANVAYVTGINAAGQEITLEVGDTESAGLSRREIYVDGSSVSAAGLTYEEFRAALRQEAQNTLNARAFSESFSCDTNAAGNFVYRTHYDLGDIVTVKKIRWGLSKALRITELQETYENGSMTVTPVFGTPLPTAIDWEE